MKILFCSPNPVKQELGAARVLIGVANGLGRLGWDCRIVDRHEMAREGGLSSAIENYPETLRAYLRRHAADYNVVDYDNHHLPFPRSDFTPGTLFVARSVLLMDHLLEISPPDFRSAYRKLKSLLSGGRRRLRRQLEGWAKAGHITTANADLVNVANTGDQQVLHRTGVDPKKICVIPYGLSEEEIASLKQINLQAAMPPRVCFLGTFDERKGGGDLVKLCGVIGSEFPDCRFRLAGTAGQYQSAEEIRSFFAQQIRDRVEIIPRFERDDLPQLLDGCTVGVFPSYAEGFGFGVLEMMAAGIPVLAYNAPGPPMMLTDTFLARCGDSVALTDKVRALLNDNNGRQSASRWSRQRALEFTWDRVAKLTSSIYRERTRFLSVSTLQ